MRWLSQLRQLWHKTHGDVEQFDHAESTRERTKFRWERIQLERRIAIVEAQVRARGGR